MIEPDVIDSLVGITPGSTLDAVRDKRPEARKHAQMSWLALFAPKAMGDVSLIERLAVARFVAGLHGRLETVSFYEDKLAISGASAALREAIDSAVTAASTSGPYGSYPKGPLSREDAPGPDYRVSPSLRTVLGPRLVAAFEHTHMLVYHPRDSAPRYLQALLDAGWSTTAVVTLSQLVSFLSFQIRVASGLRALAAA